MSFNKSIVALVFTLIVGLLPQLGFAQASAPEATPAAAAPAPVAAPAPALVPTVTKETVDNPYGLKALWAQGDFVAKGTLIILVIMSMGSWYILVTKLYESIKVSGEAKAARAGFFKASSIREGASKLKEGSAFRFIAETGIDAGEHHEGALTENIDRNTWVTMSVQRAVDEVQSRLQDGLAFLGTVGSTAPFIGLFGTVWGILNALTAIGIAGQASIDKVAGPVGESLLMTAIGLAVAVPAVLGYNWLVRRNKVTMDAVRSFAADVHGVLMGAKSVR
ncbi:MotA/TolQ/ExbB proton channel family protein [Piscinibacter sp.]|jgi:biopolymer transport protein ExbB|uniref:MotA/TolQ/ExbB proton channel family protein n=1 Tax=Piscinibacter sp. TaxID=1903157 RepID=UPI001D801769|nr:MotA/TolQ/ExbB proton channel family protein [Piscinibacter sp.]MBK7529821.1 MotA/TolQ/ExbB proton channel family protein [Piscinibacter sp.]HNW62839.1 MotA/TolQ/ExbB proton channel family protein [Piscinibacter sp.]